MPTDTDSATKRSMSSSLIGDGGMRVEELKNGWWNEGMPVMERRASGFGVKWWATRVAKKKPVR